MPEFIHDLRKVLHPKMGGHDLDQLKGKPASSSDAPMAKKSAAKMTMKKKLPKKGGDY